MLNVHENIESGPKKRDVPTTFSTLYSNLVLLETLAWCEGIRIINKLGLKINETKFREQMIPAINLYNDRHKDAVVRI